MLPFAASHSAWPATFPRERWPDPVSFLEGWRKAARKPTELLFSCQTIFTNQENEILTLCIVAWRFSPLSFAISWVTLFTNWHDQFNCFFMLKQEEMNHFVWIKLSVLLQCSGLYFTQVLSHPGLENTQCMDPLYHRHHPHQLQLKIQNRWRCPHKEPPHSTAWTHRSRTTGLSTNRPALHLSQQDPGQHTVPENQQYYLFNSCKPSQTDKWSYTTTVPSENQQHLLRKILFCDFLLNMVGYRKVFQHIMNGDILVPVSH